MNLYIHIGAPRTGTSFLRKQIFPYFKDTSFYNKQGILSKEEKEIVGFFSNLAHYGDGDELSSSLNTIKAPSFLDIKKVIISEEHLIWSVYHMMGNIGSRALLIRKYYPNAKIILTIRRQPEYFISLFKYLRNYDNHHIKHQMKSIFKMLNLYKELTNLVVTRFGKIPIGIKQETQLSLFDIDEYYFFRKMRHFISADFSWFRIYELYADLFGKNNILVLPQEMLLNEPQDYMDILSSFIGTEMTSHIKSGEMENKSLDFTVFKNESEENVFKNFILNINYESNCELNKELNNGILGNFGYCDKGEKIIVSRQIGLQSKNQIEIKSNKLKSLILYIDRIGYFYSFVKILTVLFRLLKNIIKSKILIKVYYKINAIFERMQGLDFSQIESLDSLKLKKEHSEQYETTKLFELKKWLRFIPQNTKYTAIDFGSGKGTILVALATIKNFQHIYGIEISKKLIDIAHKNLENRKINNVDLINMNASDIPIDIINKCNFFFFYNPFPYNIFISVFKKIETSIMKNKRDTIIIYFNPVHSSIIENSDYFVNTFKLKNSLSVADTYIYNSYSENLNKNDKNSEI